MRRKLLFDCLCCQVSHNFKPEGSERTGKGHSDKLQTYLKATKVPKVARSRGVKPTRSILSGCFREGYAAGHVNLKGILAKHNNETNDCPVLLRLSSDLPLVWVQLFTIRWVNSNPMLPVRKTVCPRRWLVRAERSTTTHRAYFSVTVLCCAYGYWSLKDHIKPANTVSPPALNSNARERLKQRPMRWRKDHSCTETQVLVRADGRL